jgi:hypothetical protein
MRPAVLATLRAAEARQGHARTRQRVLRVAEGPDDEGRQKDATPPVLGGIGMGTPKNPPAPIPPLLPN